jgi:hypothetical protein
MPKKNPALLLVFTLAVLSGLGLVYCFSSAQEAGKKEQGDVSLELKLEQLRKTRLEENEKELKRLVDLYYRGGEEHNIVGGPGAAFIVELGRDRLRAILESTEQGKKREDLLVPFLALVKETEATYKKASKYRTLDYRYRALLLETEIELVKAKIAASRK